MNTSNSISVKGAVLTLSAVAIVVVGLVAFLMTRPPKEVSNFEECINAGGTRMESYPERCAYDGKTYTNEDQQAPQEPIDKESDYVGLTEEDAFAKAKQDDVRARVVERDDESLPVTMDFVYGRHNFYVRDGLVYNVEIEGEGMDTPEVTE